LRWRNALLSTGEYASSALIFTKGKMDLENVKKNKKKRKREKERKTPNFKSQRIER
jgi:hypothetical protein